MMMCCLGRDRALGDRRQRNGLHQPVAAGASRITIRFAYSTGTRGYRQHMLAAPGPTQRLLQAVVVDAQRQQHEAELARLREYSPVAQRDARRAAEQAAQPPRPGPPSRGWAASSEDDERHSSASVPPIELHADGDEETAEQHVVEGRMSVSTWCLYSVSAISCRRRTRPAQATARRLGERAIAERHAEQRRALSSSLLRREIRRSGTAITSGRPREAPPARPTAFSSAAPARPTRLPPLPPSAVGFSTSSGTTARSGTAARPSRRPCSLSSSRRSAISLTTSAVLDSPSRCEDGRGLASSAPGAPEREDPGEEQVAGRWRRRW